MAYLGEAYQNLCNVQKALVKLIESATNEDCAGAAHCAREVRELEAYKRELRGKPRLKAIDPALALRNARAPQPRHTPLELEADVIESKESLNPQTVNAPPDPEAPMANG